MLEVVIEECDHILGDECLLACFHLLWIEDAAASSYLGGFFFKVLIMDFGCNEMQRNEQLCWLNLHSRDEIKAGHVCL
jgi:hypothetical protein